MAADDGILARIKALVDEEHTLDRETGGPDHRERRRDIQRQLDQCWDLLRQRDARRRAGQDPGEAQVRPVSQVEGYLQ